MNPIWRDSLHVPAHRFVLARGVEQAVRLGLLVSLALVSMSVGCSAGATPTSIPKTVVEQQPSAPRPTAQPTATPSTGNSIAPGSSATAPGPSGDVKTPQISGGVIATPTATVAAATPARAPSSPNVVESVPPTDRTGGPGATATAESRPRTAQVPASPPTKPRSTEAVRGAQSPYGVNDWNFTDEALSAAQEAGIAWVRLQGVLWRNIEPVQGRFQWNSGPTSKIDDYMAQAARYGMKVTAPISLAPDWAKQPGLELPRPDAFAGFVTAFLERYPGQIAAVEVLAEENTGTWPATKNRDAINYAPVLKASYAAVKRASPDTLVVMSSLWGSPEGYLEDLYNLGGKGYFDVANFHYYPGSLPATYNFTMWASHLRTVMEKYGDHEKPVWLTEFAWTATSENRLDGAKSIVSPQEVSDNMSYVLNASRKSGFIDKVFWYVLQDDDGMALMHATGKHAWKSPQPRLVGDIQPESTALTVEGDWTTRWPRSGALSVEGEQLAYTSLALSGANTLVRELQRGLRGTTAAGHGSGVTVINQDQTKDFKRQPYYTYMDFIQAYPSWGISDISPLPDLTPPAREPVIVRNHGFEEGRSSWSGEFTIDLAEKHSGSASARMENQTGAWTRVIQPALAVEPGRSYLLKGWVKIDPSGRGDMSAMIMANLNDSSGKFLALVPGNYYIYDTAGAWRRIAYPFRTTAGATQMMPFLSTDKGTGVAWFDDISVEPYDVISR